MWTRDNNQYFINNTIKRKEMTPIGTTIIGIVIIIAWYVSYIMAKSLADITIKIQDHRIKSLQEQVASQDWVISSMFYENDMRDAYYQGRLDSEDTYKALRDHPTERFKEWLKSKYTVVTEEDSKEYSGDEKDTKEEKVDKTA